MDLVPCREEARQLLIQTLYRVRPDGTIDKKSAEYVAKTFPNILLDLARLLIEQATTSARQETCDQATAIKNQLKPFFMFSFLLGKAPQISSLMYSYFENSSFQPLPEVLFEIQRDGSLVYTYASFNDELVADILVEYLKYLAFNPKWFSAVWSWGELGRIIESHTNSELRYLAACCLLVITRPTRHQHTAFMSNLEPNHQRLIDYRIKYRSIYDNTFNPVIETNHEKASDFIRSLGHSETGYAYCQQSLAKVSNVLLLKRELTQRSEYDRSCGFVSINRLSETISKVAYSASINKPCLLRGPSGSGKTAILDFIAAQTDRMEPPEYVKVQVGDQIDCKQLVGSYVCTNIPGQFEWQPGPLTQALAYGSWIVFEDIDSAPSEMAQVIHSVIENGNLSCVSSCPIKIDSPHPDFRIFFTQRTRAYDSPDSLKLGFGFIERLCNIVDMPELTNDDLKEILGHKSYIKVLEDSIVNMFDAARTAMSELVSTRASRIISLRDLFKLCDRLGSRRVQPSDQKYSSEFLREMLLDALDCFLASLPKDLMVQPAEKIAEVLSIPPCEVNNILYQRKPEIRELNNSFFIGRAKLDSTKQGEQNYPKSRYPLAYTRQTIQLLESVSLCIKHQEPVLLVGETGVGKTSVVQHLANMTRTQLTVINLSQQSDSSDLLGGYRPVEMRDVMSPLNEKLIELFKCTFDPESNRHFLDKARDLFFKSDWSMYLGVALSICKKALEQGSQTRKEGWGRLIQEVRQFRKRLSNKNRSAIALTYSEGSLLRAVRDGNWILLDEINLAEPDVLQCLLTVLDSIKRPHVHLNNGSDRNKPIPIHPNFRVFACMNPSTDVGKRDLTPGARGRFTEFSVDDILESQDLRLIVESYVRACLDSKRIENVVKFYQHIRENSSSLSDISGNRPVYSLRTLCRALTVCSRDVCQNSDKSLYESLKMTFLQQLDERSVKKVLKLIQSQVFQGNLGSTVAQEIPVPRDSRKYQYRMVERFWIQTSSEPQIEDENYILTPSVKSNLERLCRIISLSERRLPILIQGNTSVGKTSLIKYLAKCTGNRCYRINNHEHTDLQEYVGRFVLTEKGDLHFQEGLLVKAMRRGYWVILDELNLAPSELLEALNRVLDDNRELYIPETGETVKADSKFVLFATQNPPEEYAGRKMLSRAFRNRFIELHFDEIPHAELEVILQKRCRMAPQYAKKIVSVMEELQLYRRESGCFTGKSSYMTMRDLFRWGERYSIFKDRVNDNQFFDWNESIAREGLILLEGRARTINEADTVKRILEKVFKCQLNRNSIYSFEEPERIKTLPLFKHLHFTTEFKRLFVQLSSALKYREPVLLCGQTGCGKTTACQLYSVLRNDKELATYNCHLNTESSDFVGEIRPSRSKDPDSESKTFKWEDGQLVKAMREGLLFLMDEISLADDAVLERINSVLEPERSITLTENNGEEVRAKSGFLFVATMNPGGDHGKKELSTALRNRFTEIYCHNTVDIDQIMKIVIKSISSPTLLESRTITRLLKVIEDFLRRYYKGQDIISLRDVLKWTKFLNETTPKARLSVQDAIIHGASMVFFDQFGTCGHSFVRSDWGTTKAEFLKSCLEKSVIREFGPNPECSNESSNDKSLVFGKFSLPRRQHSTAVDNEFIIQAPVVESNIEKLVRAMQLDHPILLEGDPGAGKTSIVTALAKLTGHELVRINLSEQTDISDLFGSDLPDQSSSNDEMPKFCWHDGPMLDAIRKSKWILLDEMNLASQSVLEGLNPCFDHRGEIFIPELDKTFKVETRIFACQNPYSQGAARKGLPQSFINRFTSIYINSHSSEDLVIILRSLYPDLPGDLVEKMVIFNSEASSQYKLQGYEFNLRDLIYWCDLTTRYVTTQNSQQNLDVNGRISERSTVDESLQVSGIREERQDLYEPERFVQFVFIDRMRTLSDKLGMAELFDKIFGSEVYEPPYRDLRLGENCCIISRAILPRHTRLRPHLSELCTLKYQMPYLESIAKAIEFEKMPILVGEDGVGKRSMVRILAGITGNELSVISANREMDTVELLGSFEQKSFQRELLSLTEEAASYVNTLINTIPLSHTKVKTLPNLFKRIWSTLYATSIRDIKLSSRDMMDAYRYRLDQIADLMSKIQELDPNSTREIYSTLEVRIGQLKKKTHYSSESMYSSGNFEWIDSILIRSMRDGTWLMIENANLMNPATLDRLNSLVEPNGSLCLNEKGSERGNGPEIIKPHPNFRLILTMNPEHGELSRAMRNRGIEIFIRTRFYFEDFLMLLHQKGFEPEEQKACMTYCIMQTSYDTHLKITGEEPIEDGSLLAYFGLNYLDKLAYQIRRGMIVDKILTNLICSFYHRRGFLASSSDESIDAFISAKMNEYRREYVVKLDDDRYKWCHLRHDLVSITGGDAIVTMVARENRLFWDTSDPFTVLKPDEKIHHLDIVNTCLTVKIFLESSTHGDFKYRQAFIEETFRSFPKLTETANESIEPLYEECLALINNLMPRNGFKHLVPVDEICVDTRNSPEVHYYLQCLDPKGTSEREDMQNRWLLSIHRITLKMITDLIETTSSEAKGYASLWKLSSEVRNGERTKESLEHSRIEVVFDLVDLFNGILSRISDRCFDNMLVSKMLGRFFWIYYFICKLKKSYDKVERQGVCNQLPMLWALTYHKVISPLIVDCDLDDLPLHHNTRRKFSNHIEDICHKLEFTMVKLGPDEKEYYRKVLNLHAITFQCCESVNREVDKFFNKLLGRYTLRSEAFGLSSDPTKVTIDDNLAASCLAWSNSTYLKLLYDIQDILATIDKQNLASLNSNNPRDSDTTTQLLEVAESILKPMLESYQSHEVMLRERPHYRLDCLNTNRRRSAMDQFAPIWQTKFIQTRFSLFTPRMRNPGHYRNSLRNMVNLVNGIIVSPRYYRAITKLFDTLEARQEQEASDDEDTDAQKIKTERQDLDIYGTFIADHIQENIVLDNQVVGWTKLRVTTSDLSTVAPVIPEYAPIISLVGSYCLDIKHLKLNSSLKTSAQLDSILLYLWRGYTQIKFDKFNDAHDLNLAKTLIHLQTKAGNREDLIGDYECDRSRSCKCIDNYLLQRLDIFPEVINTIREKAASEDIAIMVKAIKLIYFGYFNMYEHMPVFTLDPSLKSREKLEVYKSELIHIKLELSLRNIGAYWKTGENLRLVDIDPEEAKLYPFSERVLVERRSKLEKSIKKLRKQFTNRPMNDDGSSYYSMRQEVESTIARYETSITALVPELLSYISIEEPKIKTAKLSTLTNQWRTWIKNIEKSIINFKSKYVLFSDLTTNYLVGVSFMLQGMRRLYSRLEQKMQLSEIGFSDCLVNRFSNSVMSLFSINDFNSSNLDSVYNKQRLYPMLKNMCPPEKVSYTQSLLLRAILLQLNHHIVLTPSDIKKCIPIVQDIAERFHDAWLARKQRLEELKKKQEDTYEYRPSRTILDRDDFERQEFIDVGRKFPLYDYLFTDESQIPPTDADKINLKTEENVAKLASNADLSMCIDICKAHHKFMKEASRNLLGLYDGGSRKEAPKIEINQLVKLEAEIIYSITRQCIPCLDKNFDSTSLECHLLQANELIQVLSRDTISHAQVGSLTGSIDILDEEVLDVYYCANPNEALKFQELLAKIENAVSALRNAQSKGYDQNSTLQQVFALTSKISRFLLTDPLMKFMTGAHTLLLKLETWNQSVSKYDRLQKEAEELVELINSWRAIELKSWDNSLHRMKRNYIDETLCELWFKLYEAFKDPVLAAVNELKEGGYVDDDFELTPEDDDFYLYEGFALLMKNFFEAATLGDYQIRLDLVFSFAIQVRFASLNRNPKQLHGDSTLTNNKTPILVDYVRLSTYVFNVYRQYQSIMKRHDETLAKEEHELTKELKQEIRIVAWQGRNLWDIKNNFRISHRKLNKVMNKYLEVLRRAAPRLWPDKNLSEKRIGLESSLVSSSKLKKTIERTRKLLRLHTAPPNIDTNVKCLKLAACSIETAGKLLSKVIFSASSRYIDVMEKFELTFNQNSDSIQSFHSFKVGNLKFGPKDSKEARAEKLKLCRQMYHSKKFAMQSIFKSLQQLGISYQRGLNLKPCLDNNILTLEPLRGMIQDQGKSVLEAASQLVDDSVVSRCNEMYRELTTMNQILLMLPREQDLTSDQIQRIQGIAYDIVIDIISQSKNAAAIYRNMMDVQAAATRLQQLHNSTETSVVIYNYARVHGVIKLFNDLVGRAFSAISKLEMILSCYSQYEKVIDFNNRTFTESSDVTERSMLNEVIVEIPESCSLMTPQQSNHITNNISAASKVITEVSCELIDKLNCTAKNYLFSDDDIEQIQMLHERFTSALQSLIPIGGPRGNSRPGTILGSISMLLDEANNNLKPMLQRDFHNDKAQPLSIENHPNVTRLNIRLKELIRQTKLAIRELHKDELEQTSNKGTLSEAVKRKMKPFSAVDSTKIRKSLRVDLVAKYTSYCFVNLNREKQCCNIDTLVATISPLLSMYTQNVACHLNVILSVLHSKLLTASQLIPFFTDLVSGGFGLPCKIDELGGLEEQINGSASEDNAGFGEGQGNTDASKKLEFESQLDDLKNGEDNNDAEKQEEKDEDEPIEAHDDGVEMSEDIDAKAVGPEEAADQEDANEPEDDDADTEDQLAELDKELDTVDDDEALLEQNLLSDEDEPFDDKQEDLREAEAKSSSIKPKVDQSEIKAERDDLASRSNEDLEQGYVSSASEADEDDERSDEEFESKQPDESIEMDDEFDTPEAENEISAEIDDKEDGDGENSNQGEQDVHMASEKSDDSQLEISDLDPAFNIDQDGIDNLDVENSEPKDDSIAEKQAEAPNSGGKKQNDENESDKREPGACPDPNSEEEAKENATETLDEPDEKSGKRTLAEPNLEQNNAKRQKIEESTIGGDNQGADTQTEEVDKFKHLEADKDDAIEVVDLISESDEEHLLGNIDEELEQRGPFSTSAPKQSSNGAEKEEDSSELRQDSSSSYNTNLGLLKYISHIQVESNQETTPDKPNVMEQIDIELKKKSTTEHESVDADSLTQLWLDCTRSTGYLVHELCQQLQIILQPTKMSKYKGDYKSGRRLNMRKIITYIASHYRKDKIWLRRTKPGKRTYNISIAVDNSSSMSENNCRHMTYQSLAMLAKSLSLIEAGSLSVVSFGEQVNCIHEFGQPYVDAIGAQWLRELRFNEKRTSYSSVLKYSCGSFAKQAQMTQSQLDTQTSVNQLLILISDGRNVTSEAEQVKQCLRELKSMGVLTLFVIVDDLKRNNGKSLVDVKAYVQEDNKNQVMNYMNLFPFPFYVLLRQIETMPSILGDALRQWFELSI